MRIEKGDQSNAIQINAVKKKMIKTIKIIAQY